MLNPASGERAGVGHYTFHLVDALLKQDRKNHYVLYFSHLMPREISNYFRHPNVTIRWWPLSRYRRYLPFLYSHLLLSAVLGRDRIDVFHAPANIMPLTYRGKTVVTLHDLAIYKNPDWFPAQQVSTRILVPQSLRKASRVIAVSEATKRDAIRQFGLNRDKIDVVYEAADTNLLKLRDSHTDIRKKFDLPEKFVLYVGTLEPRKDVPTLIQAWQRYRSKTKSNVVLAIAGGIGLHGQETIRMIRSLGAKSGIMYLGYISHNHKVLLMRAAQAFVFPSRYEGFGLPVLEAMQLGTPVITTNVSSLPEVAGTGALLVKPGNIQELAQAIQRVMSSASTREKMSRAGREQAKRFSWAKTARETLAVYKKTSQD
jgi:glycosyltransferase involved in cell wall biosynthesis